MMFFGKDMVWWMGIVEDIQDPALLGRCKVRIFGYHAKYNKTEEIEPHNKSYNTPISALPWAIMVLPTNSTNAYGHPQLGDMVFGFFLDGKDAQEPAIIGYIPHIPPIKPPEVGELFSLHGDNIRHFEHVYTNDKNTFFRGSDFAQPGKEYTHRLYRYSHKTPSGHLLEFIDDLTDIHTRDMQISHANGSKLKAIEDHLGNHEIKLSEAGGQNLYMQTDKDGNKQTVLSEAGGHNITMTTSKSGDCAINISHPEGASISVSPSGSISLSSPTSVSISSPTTVIENTLVSYNCTSETIVLSGVGSLTPKFNSMQAQINSLISQVNSLVSQVNSLNSQVSSLNSQVSSLQSQLSTHSH